MAGKKRWVRVRGRALARPTEFQLRVWWREMESEKLSGEDLGVALALRAIRALASRVEATPHRIGRNIDGRTPGMTWVIPDGE